MWTSLYSGVEGLRGPGVLIGPERVASRGVFGGVLRKATVAQEGSNAIFVRTFLVIQIRKRGKMCGQKFSRATSILQYCEQRARFCVA